MANLIPQDEWSDVRQLEKTDVAIAGAGGTMNEQAQSLLNRTEVLRNASGILDASGKTQQEINNGLESIADLLAIVAPKNGSRVSVKSYYAGLGKGGGTFIYDAEQSAVNDGVTVFNGWVRDLSAKVLTTDDAGLKGDGTDSNVTARLQAFADAVKSNFKVDIYGDYTVTTHINFKNTSFLKVGGSGLVQGDPVNWVFGTANARNRGVFQFFDSPYLTIDTHGLKIRGACKNNFLSYADPKEDGDCAIQMLNCPHSYVTKTDVGNTFAWAILAENSPYTVVRYNIIDRVVRQSGVNVVINGGTNCDVSYNRISNVGLYGVEWETYTESKNNTCHGNVITDCHKGVVATGTGVESVDIRGNIAKNCREGFNGYPLANAIDVGFFNNYTMDCDNGLVLSSVNNVKSSGNVLDGGSKSGFMYFSSYGSILRVNAPNQIVILPQILPTDLALEMEFGGVAGYFMTSKTVITDNTYKTGTLEVMTLNKDILNPYENMMFKIKKRDFVGISLSGTNIQNTVAGNIVKNCTNGLYSTVNTTGKAIREYITGNTFVNCTNSINVPNNNSVQQFNDNNVGTGAVAINGSLVTNGQIDVKAAREITNNTSKIAGGANPTISFRLPTALNVVGVEIEFTGLTTTGTIVLKVDGVESYSVSSGSLGTAPHLFVRGGSRTLAAGVHTIQMVDTVGDLAYTSYKVRLLTM